MKIDFNKKMEEEIQKLSNKGQKKSLLLHACCGPCSSATIERLIPFFNVTIYFYNPNIYPLMEMERRGDELARFLEEFSPAKKIKLVKENSKESEFYQAIKIHENPELAKEKERGLRCFRCYEFRMEKAYNYAKNHNFDYFTTTLSISPHKDSNKINEIGKKLEENNPSNTIFLYSDFKKKNGFKRSLELSSEFNLYRQDYCGCIYSKENMKNFTLESK